jgi:hypothetical protein
MKDENMDTLQNKRLSNNLNRTFAFAYDIISPRTKLDKTREFLLNVHECRCGKVVTQLAEYTYLKMSGECLSCDHIRSDE